MQLFRLLRFFGLFDDFLTNVPIPSTSSYSTVIWVIIVDESIDELVLNIEVSGTSIVLKLWIKLPIEITTMTTAIIITAIFTIITTKPDSTLSGSCCKLSTFWNLQHQGKWCSYPAKPLDKPPVKVGKSKKNLDISYWL